MIKQLSPGIEIAEIDNIETNNIFNTGINAAMVGEFAWGPVDYPVYVNSLNEYTKYFMGPKLNSDARNVAFLSGYNYLSYDSGGLYVVRSCGDDATNSTVPPDFDDISTLKTNNTYTLQATDDLTVSNEPTAQKKTIKLKPGSTPNLIGNLTNGMLVYKLTNANVLLFTEDMVTYSDQEKNTNSIYYKTTKSLNPGAKITDPSTLSGTDQYKTAKYFEQYTENTLPTGTKQIPIFKLPIINFTTTTTDTSTPPKHVTTQIPAKYGIARIFAHDSYSVDGGYRFNKSGVVYGPLSSASPITFSAYVAISDTTGLKSITNISTEPAQKIKLTMSDGNNIYYTATFDLKDTSTVVETDASTNVSDVSAAFYKDDGSSTATQYKVTTGGANELTFYRIFITATLNPDATTSTQYKHTFNINVLNNTGADTFSPSKDSKFYQNLYIAGIQAEQNDNLTPYTKGGNDKDFAYVGSISDIKTLTDTITLDLAETFNESKEVYKTDELTIIGYETNPTAINIKNASLFKYDQNIISIYGNIPSKFVARYPGELGNSLVVIIVSNTSASANKNLFGYTAINAYLKQKSNSTETALDIRSNSDDIQINDKLYMFVVDKNGLFSGTQGSILEVAEMSKCTGVIENNVDLYYYNYINNYSKYVYITSPYSGYTTWNKSIDEFKDTPTLSCRKFNDAFIYELSNGKNAAPDDGDLSLSADTLKDNNKYLFDLVITSNLSKTVIKAINDNIVDIRKDCVLLISPPFDVNDAEKTINYFSGMESTYVFATTGQKLQYDKFNKKNVWMPINPDIAGVWSRAAKDYGEGYSPAGYSRGKIKDAIKLNWNPNKSERDEIYPYGINPVIDEQDGTILLGDRMLTTRSTALGKANVRFLFLAIEKYVKRAAKSRLFEFNDNYTREAFKTQIESFLRGRQSRRELEDFKVVCDDTNNTSDIISSSGFIADIYLKPAMSINFIQLNFINTPTGLTFSISA